MYWTTMHLFATLYPEAPTPEDRQRAVRYMQQDFPNTLPCTICQTHFKERAQNVYPHTVSRGALFAWTVDMHNSVNALSKRPSISYDQAAAMSTRPDITSAAVRASNACIRSRDHAGQSAHDCGIGATFSSLQSSQTVSKTATFTIAVCIFIVFIIVVALVVFYRQPIINMLQSLRAARVIPPPEMTNGLPQ